MKKKSSVETIERVMEALLKPTSDEAVKQGCVCWKESILSYFPEKRTRKPYNINAECPLHGYYGIIFRSGRK